LVASALLLAGCGHAHAASGRDAAGFPLPDRPVASIVSARWSTEPERDQHREARAVIARAGVKPGMSVADVGAGEGYYTVRLAKAVGAKGRVLAEDIVPAYHDALAVRVGHDRLDNVSVLLGKADDPKLPPASFDRIFLIHMYHEIAAPYAFLWHLRPALRPGGRIVVVDLDRPTQAHGTPPALLKCELGVLGLREVSIEELRDAGGYIALFEAKGALPEPATMQACAQQ
jgi:ubiquinone/menaquinone biosynthesis C-methylase UbiE